MNKDIERDLGYWTRDVKDPRDPVGRLKLSDLMNYDTRAAYRHKALWEFHLGWSHAGYNHTSLASVRQIQTVLQARSPTGRALSLQHINDGNRDLCEWNYMTVLERGKGTRATRFTVNWDLLSLAAAGQFPPSVHPQGDASEVAPSVHPIGDASVTHGVNANPSSVHPVGDKDPATPTRLQDGVKGIDGLDCPPPPHTDGLTAAGAEEGQEDKTTPKMYEELWRTYYPKKGQGEKAEARVVYLKLAPDQATHAMILESAAEWLSGWAAQNKPGAPRKRLTTWLQKEDYESQPPTGYARTERSGKTASLKAPGISKPEKPKTRRVEIIDSDIDNAEEGEEVLNLKLQYDDGETSIRSIRYMSEDRKAQDIGQRQFINLRHALGMGDAEEGEDPKSMHFRPFTETILLNGKARYEPLAANDNGAITSLEEAA